MNLPWVVSSSKRQTSTASSFRPDGTLLVVDGPASRIRAFDPSGGRVVWTLGGPGEGPGELEEPVLAGADRLHTLGGQSPGPWTLNGWEGR